MSLLLVTKAWLQLLYLDLIWWRGLKALRRRVPPRTASPPPNPEATAAAVVDAVATARILYVKPVMCLQNSVVLTRLLRQRGVDADLVIAAHLKPLRAHAWVEVAGRVVTERVHAQAFYCVLDRW